MKFKKALPKILLVLVVAAFMLAASFTGSITSATGTLWSLLPPVIAIALALITKEVYSSLFIGIVVGGLLSTSFGGLSTMDAIINDGFIEAVRSQAGIFIFLVLLGVMVALINRAGGSAAFGTWASKHIKSRFGAMMATFLLGVLIFIDDYFNCLTVGAVMIPVTDKHNVSRAKLAYLIDSTAAPICMIAPISSWAAAVSSYAPEGTSGISLFCSAIPYNLYSLLTFVFIISLSAMKFDYGPMKLHEYNAMNKGDLFTYGEKVGEDGEPATSKGKVIDLIFPIIVLIVVCVFALVYKGGILDGESFVSAFSNTDATEGLPWGGMIALVVTIAYFIARRLIPAKEAFDCIPKGFIAMVPPILILTLATTLKNMTGLLESDIFVKTALESAGALDKFLPAIIFLVAVAISFATGTSWGTFGILIPIVIAIFPVGSEIGIIGMSACLAGSVCGDHCSPISDTTIMASTGAQCNHVNHVSTQLPYAMTVAGISLVCYLLAGFVQNVFVILGTGIVLLTALMLILHFVNSKKAKA